VVTAEPVRLAVTDFRPAPTAGSWRSLTRFRCCRPAWPSPGSVCSTRIRDGGTVAGPPHSGTLFQYLLL